jgi:hypothetical protein
MKMSPGHRGGLRRWRASERRRDPAVRHQHGHPWHPGPDRREQSPDTPEDRAEEFEAFLDDAQSALDEVKADPSLLAKEQDPFKDIEKQAEELGLKCD